MDISNLNDSQSRAMALDGTRSFIVQAPAGSGKTELLTQRFLKLLTTVQMPEEVVALTFTRKAAYEMQGRIIEALTNASFSPEPEPEYAKQTWRIAKKVLERSQKHNWHIITNPNRLRILTIDALCTLLAGHLPVLSGLGGAPTVEEKADQMYHQAITDCLKTLDDEVSWAGSLQIILTHFDNRYELVESLLIDMLKTRDQWLDLVMAGQQNPEYFKVILEASLARIHDAHCKKTNRLLSPEVKQNWLSSANFAASILKADNNIEHPVIYCLDCTEFPEKIIDHEKTWQGLLSLIFTQKKEIRKKIDKNSGFPAKQEYSHAKKQMQALLEILSNQSELISLLQDLEKLPDYKIQENDWEVLKALWEILPILVAHLHLVFKQKTKVDFIEVGLRAIHALGDEDNPTDLALALDYKIQHLLVDEFQDTSYTQYKLFKKLIHGWQPNDGRTLFLVGDPMQSIYRFRGAEVGLFIKVKQEGIGNIKLNDLKLTSNFRSDPAIVQWINNSFKYLFPKKDDMSLGSVSYLASQVIQSPNKKTSLNNMGVFAHQAENSETEAYKIVEIISTVKQQDPHASIAILVRARHHAVSILRVLKQLKIAFFAQEMQSLNTSQYIIDLYTLTCALLRLEDKISWLALLRSPCCGLSLHDLHIICQQAQIQADTVLFQILSQPATLALLSEPGKSSLNKIIPILTYWLNQTRRKSLAEWIECAWVALGFAYNQDAIHQAEAYFKLLADLDEGADLIDLNILKARLEHLFLVPQTTAIHANSTINSNATESVQIMTIHKAKGLEFDCVIVPALQQRANRDPYGLLLHFERTHETGVDWLIAARKLDSKASKLYQYIYSQHQQKSIYESQRVLYVAATRAKYQLHWLFVQENSEKQAKEAASNNGSFLEMLLPSLKKLVIEKSESNPQTQVPVLLLPQHNHRIALSCPMPWQAPESLKTENNNRPEIIQTHPMQIIGTFLHRLFYQWHTLNITDQLLSFNELFDKWKNALLRLGLKNSDLPFAREILFKAISQCIHDPKFKWIMDPDHKDINKEYQLTYFINSEFKTRIIDRTFIDKTNQQRWLIDYKTTLDAPDESMHMTQLKDYVQLLQGMKNEDIYVGLYFPVQNYWWQQCIKQSSLVQS